ncbi:MmcQ/YjbR family DNA-binding protein [Rhodocytophaga aerolata]|uniref:MmcQ/YjbR family DNA-binding protein n=1 Tax=Rhodocytophaga aerolata TaxID=455078 RepID=A0ABT8R1I1_9BACT|nr:MmcQ/YjbR family DNA-binding protein [Rhodocytophaga aerolata]MDO1445953.1 MmcQ/YjbR family DNA-binding protein [Rhodocytophaga aerolata]
MNIEEFRDCCLQKKGVTEEMPFGEYTLCFKVGGKIFALTDIESKPLSFNVKCDPDKAVTLREQYDSVKPGYHMNKKHWNTIIADGSVNRQLLQEWIDHSYDLVVASLPKSQRQSL